MCRLPGCDSAVLPWLDDMFCSLQHRILGQHPEFQRSPTPEWIEEQRLDCRKGLSPPCSKACVDVEEAA